MEHITELNLVDISWPINILKCSKRVDGMQPGETLIVSLKQIDTVDNLVILLETIPDIDYSVNRDQGHYLLTIVKHPES